MKSNYIDNSDAVPALTEIRNKLNQILNFEILIESENQTLMQLLINYENDNDRQALQEYLNRTNALKAEIISGMHEDPLNPVD